MLDSRFDIRPLRHASTPLPLLIEAREPGLDLSACLPDLRALIDEQLLSAGGVLLRGFDVQTAERFRRFAVGFGSDLLTYEFGSTPRSNVAAGIYTSTEYPPHQHIPLHNEQAYTRDWPMKIWFFCQQASPVGGATPIGDSRAIYRRVGEQIRERFATKGLMYTRNYGNGLDVSWEQVFNTEDRSVVHA